MANCFIVMPIATSEAVQVQYNGDAEHFLHVLEHLFIPAVKAAGYTAIRPMMSGGDVIQGQIIKHLEAADMVLCDVSGHNPNVFFELGIRTALDRPVALVRDDKTDRLPFDTSIINTHTYESSLSVWTLPDEIPKLVKHLTATRKSTPLNNDLWGYFGLTRRASERLPSENPLEAKLDIIMNRLSALIRLDEDSGTQEDLQPRAIDLSSRIWAEATRHHVSVSYPATADGTFKVEVDRWPLPNALTALLNQLSTDSKTNIEVIGPENQMMWFP